MKIKRLGPIIVRGRRSSLRKTAAILGVSKSELKRIKSTVIEILSKKLTPKEIRKRSRFIRAKLEELNLKIVELKNTALYTEKEEEQWQKRLWKIQMLCPHKNKQSNRAESEARDLPFNKHAWICKDCSFSNWSNKELEKELEELLAAKSK